MRIKIGVEDFGKIKKAEIDVSNYSIFVGDNNSGKTFLMQLIYGVLKYLSFTDDYTPVYSQTIIDKFVSEKNSNVTADDMAVICKEINHYLDLRKQELVKKVFKKTIQVERLYLSIDPEGENTVISHEVSVTPYNENGESSKYEKWIVSRDGKEKAFFGFNIGQVTSAGILNAILFSMGIGKNSKLFIPASRTGILLLYRDFYAQQLDNLINSEDESGVNHLDLTTPVYDFFKFLQTYKCKLENQNSGIIEFIDRNLISGHLSTEDSGNISYIPQGESMRVPLYLSSSMINELTPIIMALTTGTHCDMLMIDEAETSLHPKKQREMVRLLSRINNKGTRLIISTHSDTMASYLNLMVLISKKARELSGDVSEYGLESDDLINNTDVHFYQFVETQEGGSIEELKSSSLTELGVEFRLFNESLDQLYDLSKKAMGVLQ